MIYQHHCTTCGLEWEEDYSLSMYDFLKAKKKNLSCPECKGDETYRCVTTAGAVEFKGAGWSGDGYYKNAPLDSHKGRLKLYDRKEDMERETRGEMEEYTKRKLMRQNESIKRTMGHKAVIKEPEAMKKIKKAGDKAVAS